MKKIFIEAKSDDSIRLPESEIKKLTGKIGLVTTIQHLHKIDAVKDQLTDAIVCGQVLGCDASNAYNKQDEVDLFLYIGSGRFHPIEIARRTKKDVFVYEPGSKSLRKIDQSDIERIEKRRKGAYLKFFTSKHIGIIVSTKAGQNKLKKARQLKEKYKEKEFYIFLSNMIDINQMENFSFIDCWINSACPRITEDTPKPMLNIDDELLWCN